RMADFFSSRLLRWLTVPARSRVLSMASKPFYSVADRILGSKFLEDIAEFFLLFQTMYEGFVERSRAVTRTLADPRTTFVVVSTLESAPVREAEFFISALEERGLHLGAVVLNKVLPAWFLDKPASSAAAALAARADDLAGDLPADIGPPEQVARVLREVGESYLNFQVVAKREAEVRAELGAAPEVVAAVPYFDRDITDLAGLLTLGEQVWR
ncbi:MAG: ArsA-related P-loop ATPase, partial [Acidimicrobiales bacterium]|nr:ArsA-related P-loop ATPase [Acidimicrobiales bacterium]